MIRASLRKLSFPENPISHIPGKWTIFSPLEKGLAIQQINDIMKNGILSREEKKEQMRLLGMRQSSTLGSFEQEIPRQIAALSTFNDKAPPEVTAACLQAAIERTPEPKTVIKEEKPKTEKLYSAISYARNFFGAARQASSQAEHNTPQKEERIPQLVTPFIWATGKEYAQAFFNGEIPGHHKNKTGVYLFTANKLNFYAGFRSASFFQTPCIVRGTLRTSQVPDKKERQFLAATELQTVSDITYEPITILSNMYKDDAFYSQEPRSMLYPNTNFEYDQLVHQNFPVIPKIYWNGIDTRGHIQFHWKRLIRETMGSFNGQDPEIVDKIEQFMKELNCQANFFRYPESAPRIGFCLVNGKQVPASVTNIKL